MADTTTIRLKQNVGAGATTCTWTEHAIRQIEDRQIGPREWIHWFLATCISSTLWLAGALVAMEVGRWR